MAGSGGTGRNAAPGDWLSFNAALRADCGGKLPGGSSIDRIQYLPWYEVVEHVAHAREDAEVSVRQLPRQAA